MRWPPLLALLSACLPSDPDADATCPTPAGAPAEDVALSSHPWAQIGRDGIRLRVEVHEDDRDVPIEVGPSDGCPSPVDGTRSTVTRSFAWPTGSSPVPWPDRAGAHTLHEVVLTDLEPGARYSWRVHAGPTQTLVGSFRAPPAPGASFSAVFTGDTMAPVDVEVHQAMGRHGADLYLHGGDLQYQTLALDTWAGSMWAASPVLRHALLHVAPGNHEYEGQDEFEQVYRRWFGDAGYDGANGYHAVDYGGARFLFLDSEDGLHEPASAQVAWLRQQLTDAKGRLAAVPIFHRPARTLGNHAPRLDIREVLEPLFHQHDVRLVLTSHNHSYERFEVDGITWIVEGGGGALLTDVHAQVPSRPDELPHRRAASRTHGYLHLVFDASGVDGVRYDRQGLVVDRWRAPLPVEAQ